MHVVHAPDFPQAVVANVNVHCIHPGTLKSLAVAFLRDGGAEVPGMGDPVEGMYEVKCRLFRTEEIQWVKWESFLGGIFLLVLSDVHVIACCAMHGRQMLSTTLPPSCTGWKKVATAASEIPLGV